MPRKLILIAHLSLDGFAAGLQGELDGFEAAEENLEFVCDLTETADTALFGRNSFELLDKYWPTAKDHPGATKGEVRYSNWYNAAHKIVFSKTRNNPNRSDLTVLSENITQEIINIKNQPGKDILIFGSPASAQLLMKEGLIDCYWIFINPVLFGKGIPLFKDLEDRIKLKLITTKLFSNGEIALQYSPE
jgi:dihydrofolate reductase